MKILIAKTFGLGNAVCSIPMIKAIRKTYPNDVIDILIGNHPDDFGSYDVMKYVAADHKMRLYVETALDEQYDVAILSIPFSGRFQNTIHFNAKNVIDGRGRPEHSQVMGFSSWKKHEVLYQMENAELLGYKGPVPSCKFYQTSNNEVSRFSRIYLGVGYKKDKSGFWKVKHWGNENFAKLINMLHEYDNHIEVISTGDVTDMKLSMGPISAMVREKDRYKIEVANLSKSFNVLDSCEFYIGNDTGMAHVAASMDKKVVVLFKMDNASTKSSPWCDTKVVIEGFNRDVSPREMLEAIQELRHGKT